MSHDLTCKYCGGPTPTGACACPESSRRFLAGVTKLISDPLPCGHPLVDWCDGCETCGQCRDTAHAERAVDTIARLTRELADAQHKADVAGACVLHIESERDAVVMERDEAAKHRCPWAPPIPAQCGDAARDEIATLHAEVERLTKERDGFKANADLYWQHLLAHGIGHEGVAILAGTKPGKEIK